MKRRNTEDVTDVLHQYLRLNGLEGPLNEYRLLQAWEEVMGEAVARYTTQKYLTNQTLCVHLTSAALKADLMMRRSEIVKALNERVGSTVIYDIILR
jgi:predicted nucleic acid-binding Zn ribbon protein